MSVDRDFYVVYGIRLEWDDDFADLYIEKEDECIDTDLDVVIDGMGGEYIVVGKILAQSGSLDQDPEDSNEFQTINISNLLQVERDYKDKFVKMFPDYSYFMDEQFKLLAFIQYG